MACQQEYGPHAGTEEQLSKRPQQGLTGFIRDTAGAAGLGILILAAGFYVAFQFVGPPPPDRIVMATGQPGGAYQFYSGQYAVVLRAQGIELELRETAGSAENLALLESGDVDIGFVQGGLAGTKPNENVMALGSLYLEPLWLFVREDFEIEDIDDFAGARIAIGAEGSGTRAVVEQLFGAYGIDAGRQGFSGASGDQLPEAFANGELDAAFLIGAPESGVVKALLEQPGMQLKSFERADAYVRRYPFLSRVDLPQGVLDLSQGVPEEDVVTVALTAQLAANKELHPALIDLLADRRGQDPRSPQPAGRRRPLPDPAIHRPADERRGHPPLRTRPAVPDAVPAVLGGNPRGPVMGITAATDRPGHPAGQDAATGLSLADPQEDSAVICGARTDRPVSESDQGMMMI